MRYLLLFILFVLALPAYTETGLSDPGSSEVDADCGSDCVAVGEWQLSIAIGAGGTSNPLAGQDFISYTLFPDLTYYGERFFLENFDMGYTLFESSRQRMHAIIFTPGYDHKFFNKSSFSSLTIKDVAPDSIEDLELPGKSGRPGNVEFSTTDYLNLKSRYASGFYGFEYSFAHDYFDLRFQALKDITSVHHGSELRLEFILPVEVGKNMMLFSLGLVEQSKSLTDYYYGLRPGEVSNEIFYYEADRGLSSYFEMELRRPVNKNWEFLLDFRYRNISSAITDSPLVVDDGIITFFAGGVYHF